MKMEGSRQSWAIIQVRNCQNMGVHLKCAGGTGDRSRFPDSATCWDRHIWKRSTFWMCYEVPGGHPPEAVRLLVGCVKSGVRERSGSRQIWAIL